MTPITGKRFLKKMLGQTASTLRTTTHGKVEAIDIIEDAIKEAPTTMSGFLQGQVLKYMLRLWHKIDAKEDAQKAKWYLEKLISSL